MPLGAHETRLQLAGQHEGTMRIHPTPPMGHETWEAVAAATPGYLLSVPRASCCPTPRWPAALDWHINDGVRGVFEPIHP